MLEGFIIAIAVAQAALVGAILWQALDLMKRIRSATEASRARLVTLKSEVDRIVEGGKHLGYVYQDFSRSARSFYEGGKALFRRG